MLKWKWLCKLDYHSPGPMYYHNNDPLQFQLYMICRRCKQECMKDSQGNWFIKP